MIYYVPIRVESVCGWYDILRTYKGRVCLCMVYHVPIRVESVYGWYITYLQGLSLSMGGILRTYKG